MLNTYVQSTDKSVIYCLDNPFINASGCHCNIDEELDQLIKSPYCYGVVSKTCTEYSRTGNETPRYHHDSTLSINSMGLPNMGLDYYLDYFKKCGTTNALKMISIGGLSLEENKIILEKIITSHYNEYTNLDAIEINMSCPNIDGHGQLGYDYENMDNYLSELLNIITSIEKKNEGKLKLLVGLKLPPYFDMSQFETVASIINKHINQSKHIDFITCINSIGNGLVIDTDTEKVVIKPKNGFGGIGGSVIKPTALANVRKFYELLGDKLFIIGCGGITCGEDAFHHLLAGASMLSIGTQLVKEGPEAFERISNELERILKKKGYSKIHDIIGKLKIIQ